VTSRMGREEGDEGDDIFTISRSPDYGTLETVTSESSGYSSATGQHNRQQMTMKRHGSLPSRKNKSTDGIPSPIWPKYVGDNLSAQVPNTSVEIMKQRFNQQKQNIFPQTVTDDNFSETSQRDIIYTWLEGVSHDEKQKNEKNDRRRDGDHEYLTPKPVSRDYHHDIDKVMKQISLAVAKSRGVSSLSRAKSNKNNNSKWLTQDYRDTFDKYPYKVCSASLPRPKLKRLKSDRSSSAKHKETYYKDDRERLFGLVEECDIGDGRDQSRDHGHMLMRTRSHLDMTMTQNNYYNLYGTPLSSGPLFSSSHSSAFLLAKKENFKLPYYHGPASFQRYSRLDDKCTLDAADKKQRKMLSMFCKSVCFILLFLSFIMVLVTVSIFLSKGIKNDAFV